MAAVQDSAAKDSTSSGAAAASPAPALGAANQFAVQKLHYTNKGGFVCWPKVVSNDKTWNGRFEANSDHWKLLIHQSVDVDLIQNCGFRPGDLITPWVDVQAGNDASANKVFVVTENKQTATLEAAGTTLDSHLYYYGTNALVDGKEVEIYAEENPTDTGKKSDGPELPYKCVKVVTTIGLDGRLAEVTVA